MLSRKAVAWLFVVVLAVFLLSEASSLYHFARSRIFLVRAENAPANTLAMFWALEAYRSDPDYFPAAELLADLNETAGNPQTLAWRLRAAQLRPDKTETHLKWAKAALVSGNSDMASYALGQIPEQDRNNAAYHSLMAGIAAKTGQRKKAELHFTEALRLDPTNTLYSINASVFALGSPDPAARKAARQNLQTLEESTLYGIDASRALVEDSLHHGEWNEAWQRSVRICRNEAAGIDDWLRQLNASGRLGPQPFQESLVKTKKWLKNHPRDIAIWMNWMRQRGKGAESLVWVQTLPAKEQDILPIRMATADIRVDNAQWEILTKELNKSDWKDFDFARRLFLVRSLRGRQSPESSAAWDAAWIKFRDNPLDLIMAAQLLNQWQWQDEVEQVWWRLSEISISYRQMAWDQLMKRFHREGNTQGLLLLAFKKLQAMPEDPVAKNNYAFLALLLRQDSKRAGDLALQVYQSYPHHPASVSTYAFFLYQEGRIKEGLQVIGGLTIEQRNDPGVALYEGLLLKADQKPSEAQACFAKASAGNLLPEERQWLNNGLENTAR